MLNYVKRLGGIHSSIAGDVFPHGGVLTCKGCGHQRNITTADFAHHLRHGWPMHCRQTMRLDKREEPTDAK